MKKLIIPLLLVILSACNKNEITPELNYNSSVVRSSYINGILQDSSLFFYSNEFKLLQINQYLTPFAPSEIRVIYELDNVKNQYGTYYFDSNNRIFKYTNIGYRIDYVYDNELIVREKHSSKEFVHAEHFYEYSNSNMVKDSTVFYNSQNGEQLITVTRNIYTDTLKPQYMIHYSGLYEFPSFSKNLIRESNSDTYINFKLNEKEFINRYSYNLSDSKIIQRIQSIDGNNMKDMEVDSIIYSFEK